MSIGYSGTAEGIAGPHDSRIANAADPRVDSDLDGSRTTGAGARYNPTTAGGLGGTNASTATGAQAGTAGGISNSTNAGPHNVRSFVKLFSLYPKINLGIC